MAFLLFNVYKYAQNSELRTVRNGDFLFDDYDDDGRNTKDNNNKEDHAKENYNKHDPGKDDFFSRPGQSQGMLYKHLCYSLINWFIHSAIL